MSTWYRGHESGQNLVGDVLVTLPGQELLYLAGDRFDVTDRWAMIDAFKFDEPSRWNLRGEFAREFHWDCENYKYPRAFAHLRLCIVCGLC